MALLGIFGRTFGVEFEVPTTLDKEDIVRGLRRAGIDVADTRNYTHEVTDGWKIVSDSSIEPAGWEFVSPVLKGPGGINEVLRFCDTIQSMGMDVGKSNTSCGFHVHIGVDDLKGDAVSKLIRFHNHIEQRGLLECLPKSRRDNKYCKPTNEDVLNAAKRGPLTFSKVREITDDRYVALNMFGRCAKYKTVEFRRHSGTVEGPKAAAWILLNLHMVTAAAHLGRSGYGRNLEECFRAIYMYDTGEWSAWAANYLMARRQNLAGDRCRYPDMPALPSFAGEVGLKSFSVVKHGGLSPGASAAVQAMSAGAWADAEGLHSVAGAEASLGRAQAALATGFRPLDRHLTATASAPTAEAEAEASLETGTLTASAGAHVGELSAGPWAVRAGGKFGGGVEGGVPVLHAGPVSTPCSIQ